MDTLFLVTVIIQAILGIGVTLIPGFMLAPFGMTLNPVAKFFVNLFGAVVWLSCFVVVSTQIK